VGTVPEDYGVAQLRLALIEISKRECDLEYCLFLKEFCGKLLALSPQHQQ
jgi:hypothetical protein